MVTLRVDVVRPSQGDYVVTPFLDPDIFNPQLAFAINQTALASDLDLGCGYRIRSLFDKSCLQVVVGYQDTLSSLKHPILPLLCGLQLFGPLDATGCRDLTCLSSFWVPSLF